MMWDTREKISLAKVNDAGTTPSTFGSGFWIAGSGFQGQESGFRASGSGFRVSGGYLFYGVAP